VPPDVLAREMIGIERRGDDEAHLLLRQHIRGKLPVAGLQPRIRELREPKRLAVEKRRLLRVPDPELDMVDALQPQRIPAGLGHFAKGGGGGGGDGHGSFLCKIRVVFITFGTNLENAIDVLLTCSGEETIRCLVRPFSLPHSSLPA
jgi:hypothetical protein